MYSFGFLHYIYIIYNSLQLFKSRGREISHESSIIVVPVPVH